MSNRFRHIKVANFSAKCFREIVNRWYAGFSDQEGLIRDVRLELAEDSPDLGVEEEHNLALELAGPHYAISMRNSREFRDLVQEITSWTYATWHVILTSRDVSRLELAWGTIFAHGPVGHKTEILFEAGFGWSDHPQIDQAFELITTEIIEECRATAVHDLAERDRAVAEAKQSARNALGVEPAPDVQPRAQAKIYVPRRPAVLRRWRATWLQVKGRVKQGDTTVGICRWLNAAHPKLGCQRDTMAKIIRAGEELLLD